MPACVGRGDISDMKNLTFVPAVDNIDSVLDCIRVHYPPEKHLEADAILGGVIAYVDGGYAGQQLLIRNPFDEIELGKIWVREDLRGQGIGRALVREVLPLAPYEVVAVTRRLNAPINKILLSNGMSPSALHAWNTTNNDVFVKWLRTERISEREILPLHEIAH